MTCTPFDRLTTIGGHRHNGGSSSTLNALISRALALYKVSAQPLVTPRVTAHTDRAVRRWLIAARSAFAVLSRRLVARHRTIEHSNFESRRIKSIHVGVDRDRVRCSTIRSFEVCTKRLAQLTLREPFASAREPPQGPVRCRLLRPVSHSRIPPFANLPEAHHCTTALSGASFSNSNILEWRAASSSSPVLHFAHLHILTCAH